MAPPLLLTCTTPALDTRHLRLLQHQDACIKEHRFWRKAACNAVQWSRVWPSSPSSTPHVSDLGYDLLEVSMSASADERTRMRLAATCKSLRSIFLPTLIENEARALRRLITAC